VTRTCWSSRWAEDELAARADQVQAFLPGPMATAPPCITRANRSDASRAAARGTDTEGLKCARLHKAFLRYHDANNWPMLREALRRMGRADLMWQRPPTSWCRVPAGGHRCDPGSPARRACPTFRTQHTGLPPLRGAARPAGPATLLMAPA